MNTNSSRRVANLRAFASQHPNLAGSPSVFYGDPIVVEPSHVAPAITDANEGTSVIPAAIVADKSDDEAARRLATYDQMSSSDKSLVTKLPPLATWNASVIVNPNLGKIQGSNLNYFLTKSLVEYPYAGKVVDGSAPQLGVSQITLNAATFSDLDHPGFKSLPFFRFTISSSALNARPGGNYSIQVTGEDEHGTVISTDTYSFQRVSSTEAIFGVFIPFQVVATRTLPALPIFGSDSDTNTKVCVITFSGLAADDYVNVTVPGYATNEMREISRMYNLPAGMIV